MTDADGVYGRLHIAEGVADGESFRLESNGVACIPAGSSGVDIEVNRLVGIIELEEKKLGNDQFCDVKSNLTLGVVVRKKGQSQINNSLLEKQ